MKPTTKITAIITATIAFLVLFIVDLFLTLRMGDIGKLLEANLVYPYIGITGIVIVNLIIIGIFYLLYKRSTNPSSRFYYINLLVTLCVVRLFVILNNIQVILNPPTMEQAMEYSAQATAAVKVAAISNIAWISFVPYFIAVITYLIWRMDHKIEVKER